MTHIEQVRDTLEGFHPDAKEALPTVIASDNISVLHALSRQ
jgi:hypothetical protein